MKYPFKNSRGFTLIELIVVIVILGIMAAIAGPKFIDLQKQARVSVMNGIEGSIRSAATLVYSKSLIESEEGQDEGAVDVEVQGATVTTKFGYPNAGTSGTPPTGGLINAITLQGDLTISGDGTTVTFTYTGFASCTVTYAEAASAGAAPTITNNASTTNC